MLCARSDDENIEDDQKQEHFLAVNNGDGILFGDGLRCAGGGVVRLQVRFSDSTGSSSTTVDIATKGGVAAGDVKRYQIWYRDPVTSPCGALFNLSNGLELTFNA